MGGYCHIRTYDALTIQLMITLVQATANKFINDEDHALAAIGPIFEVTVFPSYSKLNTLMKLLWLVGC